VLVGDIGDEVHVWHRVETGQPGDADHAVLSAAERERAARFARPVDRSRYVAMHAGSRRLLARYLGAAPGAIRFGRTPCCKCGSMEHGRPRIEWPPTTLNHNLSGSGDHWLLAVADGRPVGVDVECYRGIDVERMSGMCLSDREQAHLAALPGPGQLEAFFRCWTRKEAVVKACGVGLAAKLTDIDSHPERRGTLELHHTSGSCPGTWLVDDLPGGPDWAAAVAQPAAQAGSVEYYDGGANWPGERPAPGGPA
jgi:4'-phosphopantetheinyl transferase